MFRGQLTQRRLDPLLHLAARGFGECIAARGRHAAQLDLAFLAPDDSVAPLAAAKIDREVGRNPVQPRRKARTRLEAAKVFKGSDKCFLGQFKRILTIMRYRHRDAHHSPLIPLDQNSKGLSIAFASLLDKRLLVSLWVSESF